MDFGSVTTDLYHWPIYIYRSVVVTGPSVTVYGCLSAQKCSYKYITIFRFNPSWKLLCNCQLAEAIGTTSDWIMWVLLGILSQGPVVKGVIHKTKYSQLIAARQGTEPHDKNTNWNTVHTSSHSLFLLPISELNQLHNLIIFSLLFPEKGYCVSSKIIPSQTLDSSSQPCSWALWIPRIYHHMNIIKW